MISTMTWQPTLLLRMQNGYDGKVLILRGTEDNLVDDKTCETYLEGYNGNGTFVKIPEREITTLQVSLPERPVKAKS